MRELEYVAPTGLEEACRLLAECGGAVPLAGGTDVLVGLEAGRIAPALVVDLRRVSGLDGISETAGSIEIGAMVTMTDVARSLPVRQHFPGLAAAASQMGCWQVRNRATLGGNLCNAAPSADTAPPLIVYQAVALIDGASGAREVPLQDFFTGPGCTVLARGDLLTGVRIPKPPAGFVSGYLRRALRRSMDIPLVNVAAGLSMDGGRVASALIVLGAVAPTPIRAAEAEAALVGRVPDADVLAAVAAAAVRDARPITDIRGSKEYRSAMVEVLVRRLLEALTGGGDR
jgi:CO/xanthine dehydrogenase FAD-binding subunit